MAKPAYVFVSHSSADRGPANEIAAYLEARGLKAWMAPRDVRPGRDYSEQLHEAILSCGAFLVLVTEASNKSPYVRVETELAFSENKPLFPVRTSDIAPAAGLALFLKIKHWTDAFGEQRDVGLARLAEELAIVLGPEEAPEIAPSPAPPPPPAPPTPPPPPPPAPVPPPPPPPPAPPPAPPPPPPPAPVDESALRDFVGPNADDYLAAWQAPPRWNKAALLFGVGWLGYRRMWRQAAIVAAVLLALGAAALFQSTILLVLLAALIGIGLWLGRSGDGLYRAHAEAGVRSGAAGGTSMAGALAFALPVLALAAAGILVGELRARARNEAPPGAPAAAAAQPTDGSWQVVFSTEGGVYQGDLEARGGAGTLTVDFRTPDGDGRVRQDCTLSGDAQVAIRCSNPQVLTGPGPYAADSFDVQMTDQATMRGTVGSEGNEPGEALFTRR
jgi:hypothetical protein